MFYRTIRALTVTAALMAFGVAATLATPGTASADPVPGPVKTVDTVKSGYSDAYKIELVGKEKTRVQVAALERDLEVRVFTPDGSQLGDTIIVKAGEQETFYVTPSRTGVFKFTLTNRSEIDVTYALILD